MIGPDGDHFSQVAVAKAPQSSGRNKGGLQEASREHQVWRDENVVKEVEAYYLRSQYHGKSGSETVAHTLHAKLRGAANLADDNLSFERPEDNKAELDFT